MTARGPSLEKHLLFRRYASGRIDARGLSAGMEAIRSGQAATVTRRIVAVLATCLAALFPIRRRRGP